MIEDTRPRPPRNLKLAGKRFWNETVDEYTLAPHERVLLRDICREIDLLERLEVAIQGEDLTTRGSQGQKVSSPNVQEARMHRGCLAGLLKQLKFADPEKLPSDVPVGVILPMTRSESGRMAAKARWGK